MGEAPLGHSDGRGAVAQVLRVAVAVLLKRLAVLVKFPAVQFDDQVVLGKVGVGLFAAQVEVDDRRGEVVLLDERQEEVLQALGGRVGGVIDEGAEQLGAGVKRVALQDVLERVDA